MNTNDTVYSNTEEEYQEICEFLDRLSVKTPFVLWESGRMNFWRYNVHASKEREDRFFGDNVHVWRSNTREIVGICISEYGNNDLLIEVLPGHEGIYSDIFRWIDNCWAATRATIEIDVLSQDVQKIHRLKTRGFSFVCHFENKRTYDLERLDLGYALEEGFTIQAFSELFAKAVIKECFARMKANGIHTVEIASRAEPDISNYNYDALSPQTKRKVHKYAKKAP